MILSLIANLFGYVFKFCVNICGNYGWAVILFSVIIKAVIFPLTLKQQKSLKKNQELQPKLAELQEKYKNDQQQLGIEYQKFMKENKFNPFGGCLLMILQLFVLIGVLYVVSNPIKFMEKESDANINKMLREALIAEEYSGDSAKFDKMASEYVMKNSGEKFIQDIMKNEKYSGDSELYTLIYKQTNRYYELKILKDKYDLNFFGIDLGEVTAQNPSNLLLWVFPVLTTIFYYISLWMVSRKQKQTMKKVKDADGNEMEMPNMTTMNIIMPLMSGWISYTVPQGMGLYWFVNSVLQIIIQLITDKVVDKENKSTTINSKGEVVLKPIDPIKEDTEDNKSESKNANKGPNPNSSKKKKKNK